MITASHPRGRCDPCSLLIQLCHKSHSTHSLQRDAPTQEHPFKTGIGKYFIETEEVTQTYKAEEFISNKRTIKKKKPWGKKTTNKNRDKEYKALVKIYSLNLGKEQMNTEV